MRKLRVLLAGVAIIVIILASSASLAWGIVQLSRSGDCEVDIYVTHDPHADWQIWQDGVLVDSGSIHLGAGEHHYVSFEPYGPEVVVKVQAWSNNRKRLLGEDEITLQNLCWQPTPEPTPEVTPEQPVVPPNDPPEASPHMVICQKEGNFGLADGSYSLDAEPINPTPVMEVKNGWTYFHLGNNQGWNGIYDIVGTGLQVEIYPATLGADGLPINYTCDPVGVAEQESTSIVPYGDCTDKILATRLNMDSNPNLDVSDIIAIRHPQLAAEAELWNATETWGESDDRHASLSWDNCWFAEQRQLPDELDWTLWWSPFGEPFQIRSSGQPVYGTTPDVGRNGEIVFVNEQGELAITDRAGSMRLLRIPGTSPEFNYTGDMIYFTNSREVIQVTDLYGNVEDLPVVINTRSVHADPNEEVVYYHSPFEDQELILGWVFGASLVSTDLEIGSDIAVRPSSSDSEEAILVRQDQLFYTRNRGARNDAIRLPDPFVTVPDSSGIWVVPDWGHNQ